jgi:hypothetical protein
MESLANSLPGSAESAPPSTGVDGAANYARAGESAASAAASGSGGASSALAGPGRTWLSAGIRPGVRPILFGLLAGAGLLLFYLGTITLAQDWRHALQQLGEDAWFVGTITAGFGTQVGLFIYLRALHTRAAAKGVVASTATSGTAMLACCAHHLAEVLPVVGLSGAAVFLDAYKVPLLWAGIAMNFAGIAYLLWQVRKQRRMACHA